ncbi:MAG: 2-amino-4-hydroxy-6-hydroxymethyldihydropteridine diphosphokinase [Myxococcota bacterium]
MTRFVVGVGSNLSGPRTQVLRAYQALESVGRLEACSVLYVTPALVPDGKTPGPSFINGAVLLAYERDPISLLAHLHAIEAAFGRIRTARWEDRPLDLDILWSEHPVRGPELTVPHPELLHRNFALAPLLDVLPALEATYGERLRALGRPPIAGKR